MILLSANVIEILYPDGLRKPFDIEKLQKKLISCCIAAGNNDLWIAEDIALSVEFSLKELGASKVFTTAEVDSFVLKVLREVGFTDIADKYSENVSDSLNLISINKENVSDAVTRYLGLNGDELILTVDKVCKACNSIGITEVFPSFVLEFAKYFHHKKFEIETESLHCIHKINEDDSAWAIKTNEMYQNLNNKIKPFIEQNIIKVSGISRLFPAIKINIYLVKFAEYYKFQSPLTELFIMPYIYELAAGIDKAATIALERALSVQNDTTSNIPVYLKFADATAFANDWLASDSDSAVEYIISTILDALKTPVIIR
jgi:hypothetical protein